VSYVADIVLLLFDFFAVVKYFVVLRVDCLIGGSLCMSSIVRGLCDDFQAREH